MAVSMIKLKVPKENLPMDNRCDRPAPAYAHSFAKAKRNPQEKTTQERTTQERTTQERTTQEKNYQEKTHQEKVALYATQLFENCDPFDLECTETLQPILRPPLRCKPTPQTEVDLLCEEELEELSGNSPTPRLLARVQQVLKSYQSEIGQLRSEKDELREENSRLREEVATLMSYFRK